MIRLALFVSLVILACLSRAVGHVGPEDVPILAPNSQSMMERMAALAPDFDEYYKEGWKEIDQSRKRRSSSCSSSSDSPPPQRRMAASTPQIPNSQQWSGSRVMHVSGMDKCKCIESHEKSLSCGKHDRAAMEMQEEIRKKDELYFQMTELLRKIEMGHEVDEQDLPAELQPEFRKALENGSLHRLLVSCT